MSSATKRKHVTREVREDSRVPAEGETIVRVLGGRGNNLHEVEDASGATFLVSMPTKFRRNVWIKRGCFCLSLAISEGDKVKGEIAAVLYPQAVEHIAAQGLWPDAFADALASQPQARDRGQDAYQLSDDLLPPSASESEEDEEDGDEAEEGEEDSEEEDAPATFNPNRAHGAFASDAQRSADAPQ